MVGRTFLICLVLAAGAAAGPGKDPKEGEAFKQSVRQSVDRGVAWLLSKQTSTGKFPAFEDSRGEVYELGMHALATLAVIKGFQPLDSPEVTKALKVMQSLYERHRNNLKTYEVGVMLMVLDAKYNTPQKDKSKRRKRRKKKEKLSAKDAETAKALVNWLQTKQQPKGLWRYPELGMDLSNTQYAALGLWSAHRLGQKINKGVVVRMLEATLERQQKEGTKHVPFILDPELHRSDKEGGRTTSTIEARGWRYMPEERRQTPDGKERKIVYPYSGSMTSAGVAVLAIGRDILGPKDHWLTPARDRRLRRAMFEGLAWIQGNWSVHDNPGQHGNWPFYWIYGLERCARLSGVEYIGRRDWYYEGATRLVPDQRPDGSWPRNQRMRPPGDQNVRWWSDQVDTCFAILFLRKSTPEIRTPPPTLTRRER
jgi:hypothetical protein